MPTPHQNFEMPTPQLGTPTRIEMGFIARSDIFDLTPGHTAHILGMAFWTLRCRASGIAKVILATSGLSLGLDGAAAASRI